MDLQNSFKVNGHEIPYYHFLYEDNLHVLLRRKNYWKARQATLENGMSLLEYLAKETDKQFNFNNANFPVFERAVMLIIHYFSDNRTHDLDNFIYKPIVDTIKKTRIIPDDNYKNLSLFYVGQPDTKDCLEVYLVPFSYFIEFANQHFYELTDTFISKKQIRSIQEVEAELKKKREIDYKKLSKGRDFF